MVRLNDEAADIFNRLFVAYLGLTYWDEEVLKEEILVTIRKRAYPSFNMDVGPLFQDRQHLVECKHIISYYKTSNLRQFLSSISLWIPKHLLG